MHFDVSWSSAVRRLPFTAALAIALAVVGVATGSLWSRANDKAWYHEVAFGLPALREGKWWTPISSAFVEPGPWLYVLAFVVVIVGMGWAEWQLGTVKAILVGVGGHLVAGFLTVGLLWLLSTEVTSWRWAEELADSRGTGVGALVVSAVAVASATVRSPWRLRVRVLMGAVVAIAFLFQGTLASVEYVLAAVIMLVIGAGKALGLVGRGRDRRSERRRDGVDRRARHLHRRLHRGCGDTGNHIAVGVVARHPDPRPVCVRRPVAGAACGRGR